MSLVYPWGTEYAANYRVLTGIMTLSMRTYFRILTGAALLAMAACTPKEQAPEGLTVTPTVIAFPAGGGSQSVVVRSGENWDVSGLPQWVSKRAVTPSAKSAYEKSVEFFAAANEEYNREGVIVIKTPTKTAEISVKQDGKKGEYMAVQSISLDPTELTLTEGESSTLTWTIQPAGASNQAVSWKSSAPTIASVDDKGAVKALAVGTAVITVTTDDGNKTSTCNVTVKEKVIPATGVGLDKEYLVMRLGDTYQLTARVMPENATDKEVVWSSLNPEIATVSSSGLVTATSFGQTLITVKTANGAGYHECQIYVEMTLDQAEITISPTSLSMVVGEEAVINVAIQAEGRFTKGWTISPSGLLEMSFADLSLPDPSLSLKLKAVQPGTATVKFKVADRFGTQKDYPCTVTITSNGEPPQPPSDMEPVDLGLSVKWAPFNLGATKPEEYGDYYAWGEKEPYYVGQEPLTWKDGKEKGYAWASYKWCMGSNSTLTKYCPNTYFGYTGFTDDNTVLESIDDAAHAALGGQWRIPTDAEMEELQDKCTWEWTTLNGVNGRKVTGPNGNSIFLPAAGRYTGTGLDWAGTQGFYWSSSLFPTTPIQAWFINFRSDGVNRYVGDRVAGHPIRPVTD